MSESVFFHPSNKECIESTEMCRKKWDISQYTSEHGRYLGIVVELIENKEMFTSFDAVLRLKGVRDKKVIQTTHTFSLSSQKCYFQLPHWETEKMVVMEITEQGKRSEIIQAAVVPTDFTKQIYAVTDVTFLVRGKELHAQQQVLASQSTVFREAFIRSNHIQDIVVDYKFETVVKFLEFIYNPNLKLTKDLVLLLLPLFSRYQCIRLKTKCEDYLFGELSKTLSVPDLKMILEIAEDYSFKQLKTEFFEKFAQLPTRVRKEVIETLRLNIISKETYRTLALISNVGGFNECG